MNLSSLSDEERYSYERGRRKVVNGKKTFGDPDIIFFLKISEMNQQQISAYRCEECHGRGKIECDQCSGSGELTCDCQEE